MVRCIHYAKKGMSNLEAEVENSDTEIETHYFCFHDKNRRKHKHHFELLFFMINVHICTSN